MGANNNVMRRPGQGETPNQQNPDFMQQFGQAAGQMAGARPPVPNMKGPMQSPQLPPRQMPPQAQATPQGRPFMQDQPPAPQGLGPRFEQQMLGAAQQMGAAQMPQQTAQQMMGQMPIKMKPQVMPQFNRQESYGPPPPPMQQGLGPSVNGAAGLQQMMQQFQQRRPMNQMRPFGRPQQY